MPTVLNQLDAAFRTALLAALGVEVDPALSASQNEQFGDYQSNAAMALGKQLKQPPRVVAERVKAKLDLGEMAAEVTIAGPGFINVRLSPAWLAGRVRQAATDARVGVDPAGQPRTVVVDYSGPNVAKQMHVGHLRSTIIGDAIARVLAFRGDVVIRQNHVGDWGTQFGMLIALLKRTGGDHARIEDLDGFYKEARRQFDADPAVADEARATVVALQAGGAAEVALWGQIVAVSRAHFQPIYDRLGVRLTAADERGESFYNPQLAGTVADLKRLGVATESEGATVVFTEGSEAPLMVEKTGGGYGYATTDLSAVRYRVGTLHADRVVYVVGSPQSQHFRQLFAAARRAGWVGDHVVLEHAAFGSVLGADGKMFKSRDGGTVKLVDLMDEAEDRAFALVSAKSPDLPEPQRRDIARAVGLGGVKYADLSKDRIGDYTFSFDKMLAMDGNTAPYLQYAHARIQSIFRRAAERGVDVSRRPFDAPVELSDPHELALARHVVRFGDVVELVARELKPHHLCTYLYELATRFSGFFENCPVLPAEGPTRASRLTLCEAAGRTLSQGLDLLGIEHPDQM